MNITYKLAALSMGAALSGLAQPISIGVKGGVPITDAFETFRGNAASYATNTKRYLIGPSIQFNLPARFAIEVDALYKRLGYQYQQSIASSTSSSTVTSSTVANSWEFPALVKFAMLPGPVSPFVDAGASWRHISGIQQIRSTLSQFNLQSNNAVEFNKRNDVGLVFGGGVEFKAGWLRITPEFRYTRWGSETFRDPVNALLRTNRNQGDFLLGLTF